MWMWPIISRYIDLDKIDEICRDVYSCEMTTVKPDEKIRNTSKLQEIKVWKYKVVDKKI